MIITDAIEKLIAYGVPEEAAWEIVTSLIKAGQETIIASVGERFGKYITREDVDKIAEHAYVASRLYAAT